MARIALTGRPILITGASSGIGRASALACARAGMPVAIAARRLDRLESLAREIEATGGRALPIELDVADADACARAVARTAEAFGSIYAVFANAGFGFERPMHETSRADLREIFEVNFWGSMHIIDPALPRMLEAGAGHVLLCSSCLAALPIPWYGAYTATKAAQRHIGRAMRVELAPAGVHVTTVHPVGTKTEFFDIADERSRGATLFDRTNERFMQAPERVARAVVRVLEKPRPEVWTSPSARFTMHLAALMPRTTDRVLTRMAKRRRAKSTG
ncbi:MAG: SDR family NAD(P)-dependent oxidoreductase [Phycisphaerales bacterium]